MDIPGLVAPYGLGPRSASDSPPLASAGTIGGPADLNMLSYSNSSMGNLMSLPPSGYGFNSLPATTSYSPYSHGPNPTYLPHSLSHMHVGRTPASRDLPPVREARNAMPVSDRSAHVKAEEEMPMRSGSTYYPINSYMEHDIAGPTNSTDEGRFATGVDTLMKAIQAKSQPGQQQQSPTVSPEIRPSTSYFSNRQPQVGFNIPYDNVYNDWTNETASHSNNVVTGETSPQQQHGARSKAKKRYQCEVPGCYKSFYQKTHLEIHTRAHTGFKPFVCREPSCGQRFSQLGNLKTHERRHTGERPYQCDECGKAFAQRGNVRAHKIVHQNTKPFTCRLDSCDKQFSQLGNLKSHQNKFHANSLRKLTERFATMREGDPVSAQDKDLWEYFASLYKNANKGIKGRGKDRRIFASINNHNGSSNNDDDEDGDDGDERGKGRSASQSSSCASTLDSEARYYAGGRNVGMTSASDLPSSGVQMGHGSVSQHVQAYDTRSEGGVSSSTASTNNATTTSSAVEESWQRRAGLGMPSTGAGPGGSELLDAGGYGRGGPGAGNAGYGFAVQRRGY